MMKLKKEPIILAVVISALTLYLFMRDKDRTNYELPDIREIPVEEISCIKISGPEGDVSLKKTGDEWIIDPQGYPADKDTVRDMLEIIKRPVIAAMVSESENYTRYGLGKGGKITVKAFKDGEQARVLEIGDATDGKRRTFMMIGDDHRVFQCLNNIRSPFEKETDDLRDKVVLSFDKEEITGVKIIKGDRVLKLTLNKTPEEKDTLKGPDTSEDAAGVWQDDGGRAVNTSSVEDLLYHLSGLSCSEYLYDVDKEGLANPLCTASLTGKKEYTVTIFSGGDNDMEMYPSTSSENDYAFMLKGTYAEEIMNVWDNVLDTNDD